MSKPKIWTSNVELQHRDTSRFNVSPALQERPGLTFIPVISSSLNSSLPCVSVSSPCCPPPVSLSL